jgi:hypothetical protein
MESRAVRSGTAFAAGYGQGEAVREQNKTLHGLAGGITVGYGAFTASLSPPFEAHGCQICALVPTLSFFVGFRFEGYTRSLSGILMVICVLLLWGFVGLTEWQVACCICPPSTRCGVVWCGVVYLFDKAAMSSCTTELTNLASSISDLWEERVWNGQVIRVE